MTQTTTPTPETRHIASYNSAVGHRADPYINETRVRLLIDVAAHQQMVGEALLPSGKSTVDVPRSLVPGIMSLVIDADKLAQAKSHCATMREEWRRKNPGTKDLCPHSVSGSYHMLHRSDMGSIRSVETIDDNLPAPMTAEERRVAAVAANVASMGNGNKPSGKRR